MKTEWYLIDSITALHIFGRQGGKVLLRAKQLGTMELGLSHLNDELVIFMEQICNEAGRQLSLGSKWISIQDRVDATTLVESLNRWRTTANNESRENLMKDIRAQEELNNKQLKAHNLTPPRGFHYLLKFRNLAITGRCLSIWTNDSVKVYLTLGTYFCFTHGVPDCWRRESDACGWSR